MTHYCNGCCIDLTTGRTTRKQQVSNFAAAILGSGLLGGLLFKGPSKARWLSSSITLAMVLAGFLFYEILPRSWALAWPQWHVSHGVDDSDDFHSYVKSKIYRAKLYLLHESSKWKAAVISFSTIPVDHLMMAQREFRTSAWVSSF